MRDKIVIFVTLLCGGAALGQSGGPARIPARFDLSPTAAIPPETAAQLTSLARSAGVIFAGLVIGIDRHDAGGYVDVTFRVDAAVRGSEAGKLYTLREWAGLWQRWPARFAVGQRRLLLLSSPGPSGMSSPVGGMVGIMPILGTRQPPLMGGNGDAPAETLAERTDDEVDLRWVQAHQPRSAGPVSPSDRVKLGSTERWRGPIARLPSQQPPDSPRAALGAVLALLGDQASEGHNAR